MAQLGVAGAGAVVGGVIGAFAGNPMLGAQIGWAIGGVAGALLFPPKGPNTEGPRLNDLAVQTSGYGVPIAVVAGQAKLSGNVIWKTDIKETARRRRQGKGGARATTTTYSYSLSWAVGICEWLIPPTSAGLLRIWLDNKIVFDATGGEVTQVPGLTFRFYDGREDQFPDPLIAAKEGAGNAPAHRGLCYIVFEDVPLEIFGNRMPNVVVEIAANVTRTFPQVNSIPPAVPLWPSAPSSRAYIGAWACNVAVDYARGRIYEGRSRTSGATGGANDELIRVYDLTTMETIGEYPMGDMVARYFPPPATPTTQSVGAGIMHLGKDGFLYVTGGSVSRVPLWKIDPDAWRAVGVFGPPGGAGNGFDDNGTRLTFPMQICSVQVPLIGDRPRTFVIVQGAQTSTMVVDAARMSIEGADPYIWGANNIAVSPPPIPIGLSVAPLSFPVGLAAGAEDLLNGSDLWHVRCYSGPLRVEVTRFRFTSAAENLGAGAAMGITRQDFAAVDVLADLDASASSATVQSVWWDATDDTLVITIAGAGSAVIGYSRFTTFKWAQGTGVLWRVVNHAAPAGMDARGRMERVLGGTWGLGGNFVVQPGAGSVLINQAGADFNSLFWLDEAQAVVGYRSGFSGTHEIGKRYLLRSAANAVTVQDVVEALCERAGLSVADVNASALTDSLRGYMLARPMSARDAITPLAAAFQFDAAEVDDVLLFRKRAGAVVADAPFADLVREDPGGIVIEEQRAQDQELPREITVRFQDIERGWEQNAQSWKRPVAPTATMGSVGVSALDLPIPLTAAEGKTIAKRMCVAVWRERTRLSFSLGPRALRLVPTDPITVGTRDGASIRCRVLSTQLGGNWTTRVEAVTEDAAVYGLTAEAEGGGGWSEPQMPMPYFTRLILPDLALVSDGEDMGGVGLREYAFAGAYDGPRWRGVTLVRSADLLGWDGIGTTTTPAVWGSLIETPPLPYSPWIWDDVGSLLVRLTYGEVESATAIEVLNGANAAALVSPDGQAEIVQFRDAEDLGGGVFRLTGLLRGRRGTEDLIASRAAGDLFLLLDDARLAFQAGIGEAQAARFHRAVNIFQTIETAAPTVTKAARGRAERPYAPQFIAASRDGGDNLALTWVRRTRVGGEWLNGTGAVPVSEASEAYQVVIYDGPPRVDRGYAGDGGVFANVFDGNPATAWVINSGSLPRFAQVLFSASQTVRGYGVRAQTPLHPPSSFRAWRLEGFNGTGWDLLDERSSQTWSASGELKTFALSAPALYKTYRFVGTQGNGGGNVVLSQVELYERLGGPDIAAANYFPAELRVIETASPAASYSAANQTADFGAPQAQIFLAVHQISGVVGRGIPAEAVV